MKSVVVLKFINTRQTPIFLRFLFFYYWMFNWAIYNVMCKRTQFACRSHSKKKCVNLLKQTSMKHIKKKEFLCIWVYKVNDFLNVTFTDTVTEREKDHSKCGFVKIEFDLVVFFLLTLFADSTINICDGKLRIEFDNSLNDMFPKYPTGETGFISGPII